MGYTHYWTPKVSTAEDFKKFAATCKELHDALPEKTESAGGYHGDDELVIKGGLGEDEPIFSDEMVWFNGDAEKGLDHETFALSHKDADWEFCKTARKPYDLLVCACLLAAHDILGYEITSDGGLDEWQEGISLYLDTIYDIQTLEQKEKDEFVREILPEFLVEEIKI